jgi:hypothetical protein
LRTPEKTGVRFSHKDTKAQKKKYEFKLWSKREDGIAEKIVDAVFTVI